MNYRRLIISLLLPQLAGAIGALATTPAIPLWYASLAKPDLAPPNWIFGPVWTTLFVLMGISFYLVWQHLSHEYHKAKRAMQLFLVHLVVSVGWSFVFFWLQQIGLALFVIAVLWLMIVSLIILFHQINPRAAYLLLPYLAWVSFASYLNYQLWVLNK